MLSHEREREVRGWIRERITVEQTEARYADFDREFLAAIGNNGGWLDYFRNKIVAQMQPDDQLWLYNIGPASWANLHGEQGLAQVRGGRLVGLIKEIIN